MSSFSRTLLLIAALSLPALAGAQATGTSTPACTYAQRALQDAMAKSRAGADPQAAARALLPYMAQRDLACNGDTARPPYGTEGGTVIPSLNPTAQTSGAPLPPTVGTVADSARTAAVAAGAAAGAVAGAAAAVPVATGSAGAAGDIGASVRAGIVPDSLVVRQMIATQATAGGMALSPAQVDTATGQAMAQIRAGVAAGRGVSTGPAPVATGVAPAVTGGATRSQGPTGGSIAVTVPSGPAVPADQMDPAVCGYGTLSVLKGLNYAFNTETSIPARFSLLDHVRETQADYHAACPSATVPTYPRPLRRGERNGEPLRLLDTY